MRNKLLEKLKRINCPNEFMFDAKCTGKCTSEQMGKCWDEVLEGYEILVSEEPLYNYRYENITFAFKRKDVSSKLIRAAGKHYGLTVRLLCPHCGKMICPDIISKMFELNYCHHCGGKVEY